MRAIATSALLLAAACGSHPAPAPVSAAAPAAGSAAEASSAPAPAPFSEAASASAAASTTSPPVAAAPPPPPPTGGVVLVGEIVAPKGFNPNPVVKAMKPRMLDCFNKARATNPELHGRLTLHVQVNEAGKVLTVDGDPSGKAYDPALVGCIGDAMKANAHFPKPGGMATINVPLVFHR